MEWLLNPGLAPLETQSLLSRAHMARSLSPSPRKGLGTVRHSYRPPLGEAETPIQTDAGLPWLAPAPTHTHPVGSCPGGTEAAPYHPKATLNKHWSPEPGHPPALLQECQADPSQLVASRALGTWLNCILRPPSARDLQKWSPRPGTARCQHTGSQDTGSAPATLETPDRPGGHPPPPQSRRSSGTSGPHRVTEISALGAPRIPGSRPRLEPACHGHSGSPSRRDLPSTLT